MPHSEPLLVLTADDILHHVSVTAESDCRTDTVIESDCACPDNGLGLVQTASRISHDQLYHLPALHLESVDDRFYLAFNPLGNAGVVMINRPVYDLMATFVQPHRLTEGVRLAGSPPDGLPTAQRLAQLGLLEPLGSQRRPIRTQPQTLTAWVHVTNDCNLRCPYCYLHKTPDKMTLERGRQAIAAVFRSAVAQDFRRVKLKYAGGESTLNFPLVLALHEEAQRLAEECDLELDGVVLSNGVALSNRMIRAMKAHQLRLMISLDGVNEVHDSQRPFVSGHGSFKHVEKALDRLAAHNFTPSISITISSRNLSGLSEVVDYVLKRGLPFTLNFYRENECSASFADLAYRDEEIIAAMKSAFAIIEANLPPYSLLNTLVDRARLDAWHDKPCGVGHSYMVIDQHGGIAKCHMEIEQTITDISASDPLKVLRQDQIGIQNLSVEEKEGCRDCHWRYYCAGGCPALTYRATGRFDVKSPNCRIYKALFPEVLRLEGLRLLKYSQSPAA